MFYERKATAPQLRLSGRTRKLFLTVHIVSVSAWIGIDAALGILAVTALGTDDPQVAATSLRALELFAIWPMFGASVVSLASGVVLGIGSKYGLVRYWWVAVKLVINVGMSLLILFALRPGIGEAATIGEQLAAGRHVDMPTDLLFPVVVAPSLLLTAVVLSIFKPWGRVRKVTGSTVGSIGSRSSR